MLPIANLMGSILLYSTLNGADFASTKYALQNPNTMETNKFGQDTGSLLALKIGSSLLMGGIDNEIGKGDKKIQKVFRVISIIGYGALTFHNIRQRH